jgi:hypothetical protein
VRVGHWGGYASRATQVLQLRAECEHLHAQLLGSHDGQTLRERIPETARSASAGLTAKLSTRVVSLLKCCSQYPAGHARRSLRPVECAVRMRSRRSHGHSSSALRLIAPCPSVSRSLSRILPLSMAQAPAPGRSSRDAIELVRAPAACACLLYPSAPPSGAGSVCGSQC